MELFALAAGLFWMALALDRTRGWPAEMVLPRDVGSDHAPEPTGVVAVVPARNEAEMLGRTLPALLGQEGLAGVVLVDDASEDRTAEVAHEIASSSGWADRVRIVGAGPAPQGWAGKVWALARGIETLGDDPALAGRTWLLLADADIELRPGSVWSLVRQAEKGYDLVSVMARLRAESFWERLLVPSFVYFFQLLYPFRRVAKPESRVAAAAGGCVLVRRETLRATGGLASIRGAIIDDVALARSVAASGGRLWLGLDSGIRSLRPYPRLKDLWRMVSRSAYDQLGYRIALLGLALLALGLLFVAPPVLLAAGAVGTLTGDPGAWRTALWAGIAWLLQLRALLPSVRHHGVCPPWAAVLPLSSLLFGGMTLTSAWQHHSGRGARWRGRRIGGRQARE